MPREVEAHCHYSLNFIFEWASGGALCKVVRNRAHEKCTYAPNAGAASALYEPREQSGKAQRGTHIATGIARRAVLVTGMTPDMPIGINGGMRERGGLKNDNDNVALSPVGVLPL